MNKRSIWPDQAILVTALSDPAIYGYPDVNVEMLETHISYIFLVGPFAYKVKKAVNLGFLDFSTLEKRRYYCEEELRLNRRLAPSLYIEVIPITGSCSRPIPGGKGIAIEYAVKMRRFKQADLLNVRLSKARLTHEHIDRLAEKIAAFHGIAAIAQAKSFFGSPKAVQQPVVENFEQIRNSALTLPCARELDALEEWMMNRGQALELLFRSRKAAGFIRECHGDFHLGNIAIVDGNIEIFDCLEFNEELRWIDVMSDIAFLVMDLRERRRPDLARRFLNLYLEITGDYAGLPVLQFYIVYRAMVRAKVHGMRASQSAISAQEQARALEEFRNYLVFASKQSESPAPAILITHGVSGSGKTMQTQALLESINAIRIRSDIERKRQYGLKPADHSSSGTGSGLYRPEITARLYQHILALARIVVEAGYQVIVDATFLAKWQRDIFRQLALTLDVPFIILDFHAPKEVLRARIRERLHRGTDASDANIMVMDHQLKMQQPFEADELAFVVTYDTTDSLSKPNWGMVLSRLKKSSRTIVPMDV